MKRNPQTFSRVVGGKETRYYDPRTPDNRNRPKSDFAGLRAYTEMPSFSDIVGFGIFIACFIIVLVIGGQL